MALSALVVLAAPALCGVQARELEVRGAVTDPDGRPVAGAEVATYWLVQDGKLVPQEVMRADEEGRFAGRVAWQGRSRSLMALDPGHARGAVVLLDEGAAEAPLALRLAPLAAVRGRMVSSGLEEPPAGGYVSVNAGPAIIAVAAAYGGTGFAFPLPPGEYRLTLRAEDCQRQVRKVTLGPGEELDLGDLDLEPTVLARLYGKPFPDWKVTDARGVEATVTLADYRGRWVLLEFWGYW